MKARNQVIKFEQNLCNAKVDDNNILFVRVNDIVHDKNAIVEIPLTHNALIIKSGSDYRIYKSGPVPVFESRKEIKDWKKGLSVEVVYVPKDTRVLIKWGTPNRLRYRDEASNKVITIGARGEFDISVTNIEQFFRKVVGVKKEFNLQEFSKRYSETVASGFADIFLKIVNENHLTYDQFFANKKSIANEMEKVLNAQFESEWGLSVLHFNIADFDLLDEDMNAIDSYAIEQQKQAKLKEYLAELERLDDKNWDREKYLRQLELQDRAAYYEVLKVIGNSEAKDKKEANKCPNCGLEIKDNDKFCPHCGKRLSKESIICPDCGKVNEYNAVFCANCGKKLIKD